MTVSTVLRRMHYFLTRGCPELNSGMSCTNGDKNNPQKLWKTYIQLTEVEDAFRITKSDFGIRPIYHQRSDRTQSHILALDKFIQGLVCFLALAMWRIPVCVYLCRRHGRQVQRSGRLELWINSSGLGTVPRKLLEELPICPCTGRREIRSLDVLSPTRDKTVRLKVVSVSPEKLKVLLHRLGLLLFNRHKKVEIAVPTFTNS
jgi:hypothetical protein